MKRDLIIAILTVLILRSTISL